MEDLEIVQRIINEKYPEYSNMANKCFNESQYMFPCNMFIMKKADFLDYINFQKTILDAYLEDVGMDIEKRIDENKDKYLKEIKGYPQNGEAWYQFRIGGYLAERLTSLYIMKNFSRIKIFKMVETENKYKAEENNNEQK